MSVPSSRVDIQMRFTREAIALLIQLTEQAVVNAIERVKARLRAFEQSVVSPVPIKTGRLQRSFDIGSTPRSIVMSWTAVDPSSGYNYALVQDIGRGDMVGKYYSSQMKDVAREFMVEELTRELEAVQAVVP